MLGVTPVSKPIAGIRLHSIAGDSATAWSMVISKEKLLRHGRKTRLPEILSRCAAIYILSNPIIILLKQILEGA
ncbi:hypothetical protein [Paraburkholderia strydomiana]|jgi:hypothetical protein|uniref:hypothetical protein n=1 Tax=Paraburkholderia strydomiana TaxID=1245417 RepID=UPI0038BC2FA2